MLRTWELCHLYKHVPLQNMLQQKDSSSSSIQCRSYWLRSWNKVADKSQTQHNCINVLHLTKTAAGMESHNPNTKSKKGTKRGSWFKWKNKKKNRAARLKTMNLILKCSANREAMETQQMQIKKKHGREKKKPQNKHLISQSLHWKHSTPAGGSLSWTV